MHYLSTHYSRRGIWSHSRMHYLSTHYSRRGIFSHSRMHYLNTNYTQRGIFNNSSAFFKNTHYTRVHFQSSSLRFSKRSLCPLCIPFGGFVSHSPIFSIGFSFCFHSPTVTILYATNSQVSVECCMSTVKIIMFEMSLVCHFT